MVEIKGLEKFASKDFPGYISSTVFLGGCNFRCPYCHNAELVLCPETIPTLPLDLFESFLDARKGWLEAVCVSGGEPLIHEDVDDLLELVKGKGMLTKLDTNGSCPQKLKSLIEKDLLTCVAMDIKASPDRYREAAGLDVEVKDLMESIAILRNSGLKSIFRTTVVPGLIGTEDIEKIGQMFEGSESFQLQQFHPKNTLEKSYLTKRPYSWEQIQGLAQIAKKYFSEVIVQGEIFHGVKSQANS